MIDNPSITILILAKNEQLHIKRCLDSAKKLTRNIIVSDSADDTFKIVSEYGVEITNALNVNNFSQKMNWALSNVDFKTDWILRLDADELLTDELISKLPFYLSKVPTRYSGIFINRQLYFLGSPLYFGGLNSNFSLRIWRNGCVSCEERELDEHLILHNGDSIKFNLSIIDNPLTDLSSWIQKHNVYSTIEANMLLNKSISNLTLIKPSLTGDSSERKRWLKNIYNSTPLLIRPFIFFLFRYLFLLGFLDGRTGFLFHFYHSLWYRLLIDTKLIALKKKYE
jgi:glycosyltransferase involved in cell wall biosynthesis